MSVKFTNVSCCSSDPRRPAPSLSSSFSHWQTPYISGLTDYFRCLDSQLQIHNKYLHWSNPNFLGVRAECCHVNDSRLKKNFDDLGEGEIRH